MADVNIGVQFTENGIDAIIAQYARMAASTNAVAAELRVAFAAGKVSEEEFLAGMKTVNQELAKNKQVVDELSVAHSNAGAEIDRHAGHELSVAHALGGTRREVSFVAHEMLNATGITGQWSQALMALETGVGVIGISMAALGIAIGFVKGKFDEENKSLDAQREALARTTVSVDQYRAKSAEINNQKLDLSQYTAILDFYNKVQEKAGGAANAHRLEAEMLMGSVSAQNQLREAYRAAAIEGTEGANRVADAQLRLGTRAKEVAQAQLDAAVAAGRLKGSIEDIAKAITPLQSFNGQMKDWKDLTDLERDAMYRLAESMSSVDIQKSHLLVNNLTATLTDEKDAAQQLAIGLGLVVTAGNETAEVLARIKAMNAAGPYQSIAYGLGQGGVVRSPAEDKGMARSISESIAARKTAANEAYQLALSEANAEDALGKRSTAAYESELKKREAAAQAYYSKLQGMASAMLTPSTVTSQDMQDTAAGKYVDKNDEDKRRAAIVAITGNLDDPAVKKMAPELLATLRQALAEGGMEGLKIKASEMVAGAEDFSKPEMWNVKKMANDLKAAVMKEENKVKLADMIVRESGLDANSAVVKKAVGDLAGTGETPAQQGMKAATSVKDAIGNALKAFKPSDFLSAAFDDDMKAIASMGERIGRGVLGGIYDGARDEDFSDKFVSALFPALSKRFAAIKQYAPN